MEPVALLFMLAVVLLVLGGAVLSGWMALWVGRNLVLAVRRRRSWPLVVAWTLALIPPASIFGGMSYVVWMGAVELSQYIGPP